MFTGIVTQMGKVLSIQHHKQSASLVILTQFAEVQIGESIAIDGVCLTVVQRVDTAEGLQLQFDVSPETWQLTTLQYIPQGAEVNMERALCIGDRLGGHFVTGHVDQTCSLAALQQEGEFVCMRFTGIHQASMQYIIKKGSIAVSGVSLTVNEISSTEFEVMLIPQTLAETNLGQLKMGDKVNIEFDMLVKVINNRMSTYYEGIHA